jgi:SAM-dependent methyltransferase
MLTVDLERAGVLPGSRVLDLGCGGGRHVFASATRGARTVAFDADPVEVGGVAAVLAALAEAGDASAANASTLVGDALALPFRDGAFDLVVASEIFEHLIDDQAALAEVARVVVPGGMLALSVPRYFPERVNWALSAAYHEVEGGHVRIYRQRELAARVAQAGFTVSGSAYRHGLHAPYWWLRCLVGIERDDQLLVRAYHRVLVWEIVRRPLLTRLLGRVLDPLIGKSLVLYCVRS